MIRLLTKVAMLLLILSEATGYAAHPFHVCVGQMEWNVEKQHWEVSLRVHPQDLERAISQSRGDSASLEDPDFSEQATRFLNQQFAIVYASNSMSHSELIAAMDGDEPPKRSELSWVGMEPERGWLWIHLEMTPPNNNSPDHPAWLVHRIFLDQIDRQENSVRIINGKNRYSLQFRRGHEAQAMKTFPSDTRESGDLSSP